MGKNRPLASNIVIDTKRHKSTMAYVTCVAERDTIVFCNNAQWNDDNAEFSIIDKSVSVISHETIHLLCLEIARDEDLNVAERSKMWFGIDNGFKKFKGDSMNNGDYVYHGLFNVDKYLK